MNAADPDSPPSHRRPDGRFRNPWPGAGRHGFLEFLRWAFSWRRLRTLLERREPEAFPVRRTGFPRPRAPAGELHVTWVGHATALVQLGPVNVLTDPMWSRRASPISFLGPVRRVEPGIPARELPPLDAVVLSHDHYDHLDEATVRGLTAAHPDARWLAPLGVGVLLRRWGAAEVLELDWWESTRSGEGAASLVATCTPARHFASRSLFDRNRRLWCGWSLAASGRRVFFAGDTAYHPEFAAIGGRLGPFDAALLPIGAYEPRWFMREVHMSPEEAVQAWRELSASAPPDGGGHFVPVHWGTFRLTDEPMDEPPRRLREAWLEADPPGDLARLAHGETRRL